MKQKQSRQQAYSQRSIDHSCDGIFFKFPSTKEQALYIFNQKLARCCDSSPLQQHSAHGEIRSLNCFPIRPMFVNMAGGAVEKNNLASDVCTERLFILPIGILMKPARSRSRINYCTASIHVFLFSQLHMKLVRFSVVLMSVWYFDLV